MYPVLSRLAISYLIFSEIYFIILLNYGIKSFNLGIQELVGGFTVFAFLMLLRIADDLKDYKTDKLIFPERALPSGRVKKHDLFVLLAAVESVALIINILFMNNLSILIFLYIYGLLMSLWFFNKKIIQKNLPLALITHNPVQILINIYIISFTCIKYGVNWWTLAVIMAALTMYFPGLMWEVSRKIIAPKDETKYTTYSKIFGYKKSAIFVLVVILLDIVTNIILVWNLNKVSIIALLLDLTWIIWIFKIFINDPNKFKLVDKVIRYTYVQESLMIMTIIVYLMFGKI